MDKNIDFIKTQIKNILCPETVGIFSEDDIITQEIIDFVKQLKPETNKLRKLFLPQKDKKKRQQNVEQTCLCCGKNVKRVLTTTQLIPVFYQNTKFLCEDCKKEANRKTNEEKHEAERRAIKLRHLKTCDFRDFLDPTKAWGNHLSKKQRIRLLKNQDVFWEDIEQDILEMPYLDFLRTPYWVAISDFVKLKNNYKCEICGKGGVLHVHHPNYDFHGRELQNIDKLKCLCADCHEKFHNKGVYDG